MVNRSTWQTRGASAMTPAAALVAANGSVNTINSAVVSESAANDFATRPRIAGPIAW
jgi:hypothetical protein